MTAMWSIFSIFRGLQCRSRLSSFQLWSRLFSAHEGNYKTLQPAIQSCKWWRVWLFINSVFADTKPHARLSQAVRSADWSIFISFWATGRNSNSQHALWKSLKSLLSVQFRASSSSKEFVKTRVWEGKVGIRVALPSPWGPLVWIGHVSSVSLPSYAKGGIHILSLCVNLY